jgi:hypothetical protein
MEVTLWYPHTMEQTSSLGPPHHHHHHQQRANYSLNPGKRLSQAQNASHKVMKLIIPAKGEPHHTYSAVTEL